MRFDEIVNDSTEPDYTSSAKLDVGPDGGEFTDFVTKEPVTDWDMVFEQFNLDPTQFEVVGDTVRMSTWQQSKRTENGERDVVQLYSYRASFRRINRHMVPVELFDQWKEELKGYGPIKPAEVLSDGCYVILVADPQLGKKGTSEAIDNWQRGVSWHVATARAMGVESVHVAFMGDEIEAVTDSYTNQPHTIELNQSQQLELDFDLRVWTMKQALSLGVPVSASSVISNHGEWTRKGSKDPVTTQNDNASTHIARQVQKLFKELEEYGVAPIEWHIGDSHPGVTVTLGGVECYFSHGYVEKGRGATTEARVKNAIERQILGRTEDLGTIKLWFMAHYHHLYMQEFEGRTLFGCPALEAERSSEYMLDQYGIWSPPGMLGMLVSDDNPRGWSFKNVY